MLGSGNGNPMKCVSNLLRITRGECAYDRVKGIDPTFIDQPVSIVKPLIIADAKWLIATFEPRVSVDSINLGVTSADNGGFSINVESTMEG